MPVAQMPRRCRRQPPPPAAQALYTRRPPAPPEAAPPVTGHAGPGRTGTRGRRQQHPTAWRRKGKAGGELIARKQQQHWMACSADTDTHPHAPRRWTSSPRATPVALCSTKHPYACAGRSSGEQRSRRVACSAHGPLTARCTSLVSGWAPGLALGDRGCCVAGYRATRPPVARASGAMEARSK